MLDMPLLHYIIVATEIQITTGDKVLMSPPD